MTAIRGWVVRVRAGAGTAAGALCAAVVLLTALTGCGTTPDRPATKNGDTAPLAGRATTPSLPVPRGRGSRLPSDFNGDGHRDLVLNDLVKSPTDSHGDDSGIGIVYGTQTGADTGSNSATGAASALDPAVRQLLTPREHGAEVQGVLPAAFDAEASCDLDKDGYTDLIVATDPPYDGIGRPPVPLQLLFGSPTGITGRAVVLRIPEQARYGNDWPDHPVCGDFDGDGSTDLAVTASADRVSFLRGPFSRKGAPRTAAAPVPGGGPALAAPAGAADTDADGADDLVVLPRTRTPGAGGKLLLGGPTGPARPGGRYTFDAVTAPPAPGLPEGETKPVTDVLVHADFDGDERPDMVTRTHRGERADVIALYAATKNPAGARPLITFSTSIFLP
ncbi:FG-GAP repeat domain-containing protein [Streptomyces xantholiticus]|uniref:FG-GAP repeat domain-containing protein n=1 Tax=Streptomyces xantholiticus TaxID=68285 RepID=UPI00167B59C7|nr:VCBS repeat-containing protein [Streptomyces xantholiticus]